MKLEDKTLLLALAGTSAAFAWVVQPYIGPVFWAIVLAIVFTPLYRRMLPIMRHRATPAALATLFVGITGVGMPTALIAASLLRQAAGLRADMASHRVDFGAYGRRIVEGLPPWVRAELGRLGLGDLAAVQETLTSKAVAVGRFVATHLLGVGLDAFGFAVGLGVMLYVFFFLLRDGASLAVRIHRAVPLADHDKLALFGTIVTVIRATVRGGVVMATTQGVLGGAVLGWLGIPGPVLWQGHRTKP